MDQVTLHVPSSIANDGPGYDIFCLGNKDPYLAVTATRTQRGVTVGVQSLYTPPSGRELGHTGIIAAKSFLTESGIDGGIQLQYNDSDSGYPVGGLGRSGAEAVGAIMAVALLYDRKLTRDEVVIYSARGEPGEHKDNVAASTNGKFNIVATSPDTGRASVDFYDVPDNLGMAIGFSSHQKIMGTAGGRRILQLPVLAEDLVYQTGLVAAMAAAMVSGNTNRVLEIAAGDRFHEERRANIGFYGNFGGDPFGEFTRLKRQLYNDFQVAWAVAGAGANMLALYPKNRYPDGIVSAISPVVVPWFRERGIEMRLQEAQIAEEGTYDYAQRNYNY